MAATETTTLSASAATAEPAAVTVTDQDYKDTVQTVARKSSAVDVARLTSDEFRKLFLVLQDASGRLSALTPKAQALVPAKDAILDSEVPTADHLGMVQLVMWANIVSEQVNL